MAEQEELNLVVTLVDNASQGVAKLRTEMAKIGGDAKSVSSAMGGMTGTSGELEKTRRGIEGARRRHIDNRHRAALAQPERIARRRRTAAHRQRRRAHRWPRHRAARRWGRWAWRSASSVRRLQRPIRKPKS